MASNKLAYLAAGCALLASSSLWAHGYISTPESRGFLCKLGGNSQCGAVQWEPQSLEGFSGYPAQGPADGRIASAGLAQFAELDEQTASRWMQRPLKAGANDFTWNFTANHVTRGWRYYITKQDWNPNQKLSRASFESTPFCSVDGQMQQPAKITTHSCNLPARTGYQIILGVWEVGDTPMSFYNLIDARFDSGSGEPSQGSWPQRGTIYPSLDLRSGDRVQTRVFDANGERGDLQTRLTIASDNDGQRNNWAYLLAARINAEQSLLQAGQNNAGSISPVYGQNGIFVRSDSGIQRIEVQIDKLAPPVSNDFSVSGLQPRYSIDNGRLSIAFNLSVVGELDISSYLYDHNGTAKGFASTSLNNSSQALRIEVTQAQAGHHQLVVKAQPKNGDALQQKTFDLMFDGPAAADHDYVFPDGLRSYKAGTLVLQTKTARVYRCRPFPNSGYCVQWSSSASHFEPGVGSHWRDAWIEQ